MTKSSYLSELSKIVNVPEFVTFTKKSLQTPVLDFFIKNISKGRIFAVRSSSTEEDQIDKSNAGVFDTFLYVNKEELKECILKILEKSEEVIVQEMITNPDYSGVVFIDNKLSLFALAPGLNEGITSGKVFTTDFLFEKNKLIKVQEAIIKQGLFFENYSFVIKNSNLNLNISENLFKEVLKIKKHFKFNCDIEFTVKDNIIYFLQVRPLIKDIG